VTPLPTISLLVRRRSRHPDLPSEPDELYDRATFDLTEGEAEFLRERICSAQPMALLARLVTRATEELNAPYAWDPRLYPLLTNDHCQTLEHARRFALCAWGGPLMYTRMVAGMKGKEELVAAVTVQLGVWQREVAREAAALSAWDRVAFWELIQRINPRLSRPTRATPCARTWPSDTATKAPIH
jgi:hypothetical protein